LGSHIFELGSHIFELEKLATFKSVFTEGPSLPQKHLMISGA